MGLSYRKVKINNNNNNKTNQSISREGRQSVCEYLDTVSYKGEVKEVLNTAQ